MTALTNRLTVQYAGAVGAAVVLRVVVRAVEDLRGGSAAEPPLEVVEEVARRRLVQRLALNRVRR